MENLWTLKFDIEKKLPLLVRSKTNVGSNISFLSNRVYENIQNTPTDPIDVVNNFPWTKSPTTSRNDVPKLRLIEKRITKNSTVTNLAYSLLAGADATRTIATQGANIADSVLGNEDNTVQKSLNNVLNSKTFQGVKKSFDELSNFELFQSDVLKPYNFLYSTERTGFQYLFPYLDDSYRESNIQMGDDQSNLASGLLGGVSDLVQQVAGAAFVLRPGVYIEEAKQFSMGQMGRTLNVTIPLLNTGNYEDIIKNWQLIFGLVYQNRPGRITKNLVDIPVIYETFIEGVAYMPYSYIKSLSVKFLGNRRTMKIKIPVTKSSEPGSDVAIQSREITTTIPDAYELNISIEGLNEETRNFMYQSIDGLPVTVKGALPKTDIENIPQSVSNAGPKTVNQTSVDNGGGNTSFSSRSNPGRAQVRNTSPQPGSGSTPKIKRRNN